MKYNINRIPAQGGRMVKENSQVVNIADLLVQLAANQGVMTFPESVIERVTSALKTIETSHAYIHEGIFYESWAKASILTGATYWIAITTPVGKYLHYTPSNIVTTADKLLVEFYEGGSFTGGDAATIANHKRSGAASATVVKTGVTVAGGSEGSKITQVYVPGSTGVGGQRNGSQFGPGANEWILKPNTTYLYKLTNGSDNTNVVQLNFFWYEEAKE